MIARTITQSLCFSGKWKNWKKLSIQDTQIKCKLQLLATPIEVILYSDLMFYAMRELNDKSESNLQKDLFKQESFSVCFVLFSQFYKSVLLMQVRWWLYHILDTISTVYLMWIPSSVENKQCISMQNKTLVKEIKKIKMM